MARILNRYDIREECDNQSKLQIKSIRHNFLQFLIYYREFVQEFIMLTFPKIQSPPYQDDYRLFMIVILKFLKLSQR